MEHLSTETLINLLYTDYNLEVDPLTPRDDILHLLTDLSTQNTASPLYPPLPKRSPASKQPKTSPSRLPLPKKSPALKQPKLSPSVQKTPSTVKSKIPPLTHPSVKSGIPPLTEPSVKSKVPPLTQPKLPTKLGQPGIPSLSQPKTPKSKVSTSTSIKPQPELPSSTPIDQLTIASRGPPLPRREGPSSPKQEAVALPQQEGPALSQEAGAVRKRGPGRRKLVVNKLNDDNTLFRLYPGGLPWDEPDVNVALDDAKTIGLYEINPNATFQQLIVHPLYDQNRTSRRRTRR